MLTQFILEILNGLGTFSMDFLDAILSNQTSSYKKLRRMITYGPFYHELFSKPQKLTLEEYRRLERQRFYNLLNYLQKQGLVAKHKEKEKRNSFWVITRKGKEKLEELEERRNNTLPKIKYEIKKDDGLKIITFDIPEKERRKRDWLRQNLLALNFSPLQKSVWVGYSKLPEEFLTELKELSLFPYIEIFTVHKSGTIGKYKPRF